MHISCVTLDKWLKLSEPKFSYLWNKGHSAHLKGLLWGLDSIIKATLLSA